MNRIAITPGALTALTEELPVQPQDGATASPFALPQQALEAISSRVQGAKQSAHEKPANGDDAAQMQMLMALLLTPPAQAAAPLPTLSRGQVAAPLLTSLAKMQNVAPTPERAQSVQPESLPPQLQAALTALTPDDRVQLTPVQQAKQLQMTAQDLHAIAPATPERRAPQGHEPSAPRVATRLHAADKPTHAPVVLASTPLMTKMQAQIQTVNQPEQVMTVDSRDADWGEKLTAMLKESIHFQIGQREQTSTIRLDPPSLGKLEIAIHLDAGKLTVHIGASQADVCRTLTALSDNLRAQLTEQNFVQVEVQVSPDGQSQQQGREQERAREQQIQTAANIAGETESSTESDSVLIKV